MKRSIRSPLLLALAAALIGACGGASADEPTDGAVTTTTAPNSDPESVAPVVADAGLVAVTDLVATARGDLAVYAAIGDVNATSTLPAATEFGSPTTVRVTAWEGESGEWLDVALPTRPNGSHGFVRAADVDLARVEYAIDVDLGARMLTMRDGNGAAVLSTAVAIGSPDNPTPTGDFYVTDVLDTGNDAGAYGPYALGLSAHSETLSEFGGGDGQVGIHGTNQPSSIGQNVSHGCVRVPNDVVSQLAAMVPLGTPVSIH
ncbi:MAG: L,D-transpeptidase [Actinomycetota bacterium]